MMQRKSLLYPLFPSMAMLILILDAKTAFDGATEGMTLCLNTVIPSLFPFFVVSMLLCSASTNYSSFILRPIGKWLKLPESSEILLLIGFLGGYPVGAQCIRQMYDNGNLSLRDAHRMLAFCNNAGPAFIFGIGTVVFQNVQLCWLIWVLHILSALIVGWITPADCAKQNETEYRGIDAHPLSLAEVVSQSIKTMAFVCSWIILFRVILTFLQKWILWLLPQYMVIFLSGILELANGTTRLSSIDSISTRFLLFSILLGFGGLSVAMQTHSVIFKSGLSLRPYLFGKLTQGAVSCLLCVLFQPILFHDGIPSYYGILATVSFLIFVLYCIHCKQMQKRYSIPIPIGV